MCYFDCTGLLTSRLISASMCVYKKQHSKKCHIFVCSLLIVAAGEVFISYSVLFNAYIKSNLKFAMSRIVQVSVVLLLLQNIITSNVSGEPLDDEVAKIKEFNKKIKNFMRPEVDPCKNFFEYACGNYHQSSLKSAEKSVDEISLYWIVQHELKNSSIDNKIKNFYQSCIKHLKIEEIYTLPKYVETWPATESKWSPSMFSWVASFAGWRTYTEALKFVLDFKTIPNSEFLIFPGYDIIDELYAIECPEEIKEIQSTIISAGIDETEAKSLTEEIVEFSKKLVSELKNCQNDENWYVEVGLEDVKSEFPLIDWKDLLQYEFNNNSVVLFVIIDQVRTRKYLNIISDEQRVAYNYFTWITVYKNAERWCTRQTIEYFSPALFAKFAEKIVNSHEIDSYKVVAEEVIKSVKENSIQDIDIKHIQKDMKNFLDYMVSIVDLDKIEEEFKNVEIDAENYLENVKNLDSIAADNDDYDCKIRGCLSREQIEEILLVISIGYKKPTYAWYSLEFPTLFKTAVNADAEKVFNSTVIEKLQSCFEGRDKIEADYTLWKFMSPTEDVTTSGILKLSHEQYKRYLNEEHNWDLDEILDGIGLNSEKAFFVNYVQNYCDWNAQQHMSAINIVTNLQAFVDAFNCPIGTPMNPEKNCFKL